MQHLHSRTCLSSFHKVSRTLITRVYSTDLENLYRIRKKEKEPKKKVPSFVAQPNKPSEARTKKIAIAALEGSNNCIEKAKSLFEDPTFKFEWFQERIHRSKDRQIRDIISSVDYILCIHPRHILLKETGAPNSSNGVWADFIGGKAAQGEDPHSPLVRAVKFNGYEPSQLKVVDATAGLGGDGFVLGGLGCHVTMVEKDPVIHLLLQDGLQRATRVDWDTDVKEELLELLSRLKLVRGDAIGYLRQLPLDSRPDIVFLDPMFPRELKRKDPTGTKHPPSKILQILRGYLNHEARSYDLLQTAREVAKSHVILKRPFYVEADPLAVQSFRSRSIHFDVYQPFPAPSQESTSSSADVVQPSE